MSLQNSAKMSANIGRVFSEMITDSFFEKEYDEPWDRGSDPIPKIIERHVFVF